MFFLYLLFWPIIIFFMFNLILLPFGFTLRSLISIFTVPRQIYEISRNPRLKRNHALEHATVNVLEQRFGVRGVAGLAHEDGFSLKGAVNPDLIEESAREGLSRVQQGEHDLVIHDRCGTSIGAANLVSSVAFLLLLYFTGYLSLWNVIIAMIIANLIGPPIGRIFQSNLTTDTDIGDMEIVGVEYMEKPFAMYGVTYHPQPTDFFVRTRQLQWK